MNNFPEWARNAPTPTLIYQLDRLNHALQLFARLADRLKMSCCFAVKANRHPELLDVIATAGFGFDVASGQEFDLVRSYNSAPIVACGPGLSVKTMKQVDERSGTIFFDNVGQLSQAETVGIDTARHGLRLAVPGDYSAFGFSPTDHLALRQSGYDLHKVQVHAGEYFDPETTIKRLDWLRDALAGIHIDLIDFGGGFGVLSNCEEQLRISLTAMRDFARDLGADVIIEPGKAIVARCGYLVASVLAVKRRASGQIAIIDSSSYNLGQMERRQLAMSSNDGNPKEQTMVIGPTCYEGDIWGEFMLPQLLPGDRLLFSNMGAYTTSLAGSLHGLPQPGLIFRKPTEPS